MIPECLPDTSPEDVAVVHIHHDPLSIERVLVDGAYRHPSATTTRKRETDLAGHSHVASGVVGRDVASFGRVV